MIEVLNTSDTNILWHFNTVPTTPKVEYISKKLIRVIATFNASDLAILIESQLLDLDLDVQDQTFQTSVDNFGQSNFNFGRVCTRFLVACSFYLLKDLKLRFSFFHFRSTECQLESTLFFNSKEHFFALFQLQLCFFLTSVDKM